MTVTEPRKKTVNINFGKVPPQAKELEEAILGGIMLESGCFTNVLAHLFSTDIFYLDAHQRIFRAMLALYDKHSPIDILTVIEQLKVHEELELVGGPYYITRLTNAVVSTANIEAHCHILIQKYMSREMIRISGEAMNEAYEDCSDVFEMYDKADNEIINVQEKVLTGAVKDMGYYASQVYDQYETVKSTGVLGIQTGITPLNKIISGLVSPDLIIFAARPGAGKTSLALSISHYTSVVCNIPCAWFSLEMDGTQLVRRLASIDSGVSHENIRQGKALKEDETKFYKSLDKIAKSHIYIEDKPAINIRSIRTRATILKRKNKIKYIVVDYLQLMKGVDPRITSREAIVSDISRGLKELAKELQIPIIALSQLNREVEARSDKMPQMSDLRESGAIEQDADEILLLMRPEYYGFLEPVTIDGISYNVEGLCIGKMAKNRHGACKNFAMYFGKPTMNFTTHPQDSGFTSMRVASSYYEIDKAEEPPF